MNVLKVTNALTYKPFATIGKAKVRTMNPEKKAKEREKLAGTCKICGAPLTLVPDTNVLICSNETCKGFPVKAKNENGKLVTVARVPVYRCLSEGKARYAEILFN